MSQSTPAISSLREAACAAVAALTILSGCAARQPASSTSVLPPNTAMPALAGRDRILTSLQTPAIMEYWGPSGHLKAREQFTIRRPASLRIEAMSPLGIALIVAADDAQIAVFNPSNDTLIRGPANATTLARFTQIPMPPTEAVQLLLGLAPDESLLTATPSSSQNEGDMKVLSYGRTGADNVQLGFTNGELALVRANDASGQLQYEVHYSDYRDIGAVKFPFALEARFAASSTTIKLRYLNPSIDRHFDDSTFVLSPGPRTRLIEIGTTPPATQKNSG
ncbi:MAG TPA: DUF4292 domain-containing protein [Candidatus Binataceae bacterium]|nr:DUF4292 domain-containing protein [Candidatus Binataceae bacterium]